MAKFNVVGLDDIQARLLRRENQAAEAVPEMLKAGGEVLKEVQKKEILSTFKGNRSTGDMAKSIVVSKVKETSDGQVVEVYPSGTDRHGVRNATKAFVLQYGRSNMPATPWLTAANTKAADDVNAEMRSIWEKKQNEC